MAVLIGHASISETGGINGAKGDSTGKEVCTRTWYSKPWDYMAIHPDANVRENHAKAIEAACANNNIGYGQADRNTAYTEAKKVNYAISKITTKCNTDCSALQNLAAVASGAPGVTYGSNGWTTSTMKSALQAAGYKIITDTAYLTNEKYCVRGAMYVKSGSHTVCGLSNGASYASTLAKAGITTTSTVASTSSSTATDTSTSSTSVPVKITSNVQSIQTWLNTYFSAGLVADGIYGTKTKAGLVKAWQKSVGGLTIDGIFGTNSQKAAASKILKKGSTGILVTIWQAYLVCKKYSPNGVDGIFGSGCYASTIKFQADSGFSKAEQDGEVGKNTWTTAFK